ncbi:MAG TPA: lipoyl(octanoyl) transferase LipB [Steroidobacter sp.]|nr:lipoyl(octanoyl) transferase LipB [Steroidobacter sp.]
MTSLAPPSTVLRWLGRVDYEPTWRAMQSFTAARTAEASDEIWFLEHPPVFTLGMNAAPEHVLAPGDVPLVHIDRGGQVTYHGPGQLVIYPLLDLRRSQLGVRELVVALETAVIEFAASWNIAAFGRREAPGVYVDGRKLASVGLRIRRGCSYHGMAFNIAMDLEPFRRINPCGYPGLDVIDLRSLGVDVSLEAAAQALAPLLLRALRVSAPAHWTRESR